MKRELSDCKRWFFDQAELLKAQSAFKILSKLLISFCLVLTLVYSDLIEIAI